jgi:hypothetical protein
MEIQWKGAKNQWRKAAPWVRILATLLAPVSVGAVVSLFGFIAWGFYDASEHFGFLPITTTQYLAAGTAFMLPMAIAGLFIVIGIKFLNEAFAGKRATVKRMAWSLLSECLAVGLAFLFAEFVFLQLSQGLHLIIYQDVGRFQRDMLLVTPWVSSIPLFFRFNVLTSALSRLLVRAWHCLKSKPTLQSSIGVIEKRGLPHAFGLCFALALIFVALLGAVYLPAIDTGFGGAKPRHALFDVVVEDLANTTRGMILEPKQLNHGLGIVQTPEMVVYFANEDFVLVKPLFRNPPTVTVRIPMTSIKAITWID